MTRRSNRLAFFLPSLHGGGAERMMVNLLRGASAAGIPLDLILGRAAGPYLSLVPSEVRIIDLNVSHLRFAIVKLARYLRRERPSSLLSRMAHTNMVAVAARLLAQVDTRVVVVEAVNLSENLARRRTRALIRVLMKGLYSRADAILSVSAGTARDLETALGISPGRVQVIYNPVVDASLIARSREPVDHPWFAPTASIPVFLNVGRLDEQKDQATLLRAFAVVRRQRPARLVILGQGNLRGALESLRSELGLDADVDLPGFVDNPYAYMRRASAFVLSSLYEGLPNALIEALACGCPSVSTDCPNGPEEILERGRYGLLVMPREPAALASAMLETLDRSWDREELRRRGAVYSVEQALPQYLAALDYGRRAAPETTEPAVLEQFA